MTLLTLLETGVFPLFALLAVAAASLILRPARPGTPQDHVDDRPRPPDDVTKQRIGQAVEAKRKGDLLKAGWHYENGHLLVKAAECFDGGGDPLYAATLYRRGKDFRRAGELFRRHGYPLDAASALEHTDQPSEAAVIWSMLGDLPRAAQQFARAGRHAEAAEMYGRLGMHHQSGQLFETARDWTRAADAYEQMVQSVGRKRLHASNHIGALLEEEGRIDAAIRFREAVGDVMHALRSAIKHRRDDDAVRIYRDHRAKLEEPLKRGARQGKLSAKVLADLFQLAGDNTSAAEMAELLGQALRSAKLRAQTGDHMLAAEAWLVAGETAHAAQAFERAGEPRRAAELYEEIGETQRARIAYRDAGVHFHAGRLLEAEGRRDAAVASYQRVAPDHEDYVAARLQLGRLMAEAQRLDLAIDFFIDALSSRVPTDETIDDLTTLARLLEARQRYGEAAACLVTIGRIDETIPGLEDQYHQLVAAAERMGQDVPDELLDRDGPSLSAGSASGLASAAATMIERGIGGGSSGARIDAGGQTSAPKLAAMDDPSGVEMPAGIAGATGDGGTVVSFETVTSGWSVEDLVQDLGQLSSRRSRLGGVALAPKGTSTNLGLAPGSSAPQDAAPAVPGADDAPAAPDAAPADAGAPAAPEPPPTSDVDIPSNLYDSLSFSGGPDTGPEPAAELGSDTGAHAGPATAPPADPGLGATDSTAGTDPMSTEPPAPDPEAERAARRQAIPKEAAEVDPGAGRRDGAFLPSLETRAPVKLTQDSSQYSSLGLFQGADSGLGYDTSAFGLADPTPDTIPAPLASFALFEQLTPEQRELLQEHFEHRELAAGDAVLTGSAEADGLVLLGDGALEVATQGVGSQTVDAPAIVGRDLLAAKDAVPMRARAVTDAHVWVLSRAAMQTLSGRDRRFAAQFALLLRDADGIA